MKTGIGCCCWWWEWECSLVGVSTSLLLSTGVWVEQSHSLRASMAVVFVFVFVFVVDEAPEGGWVAVEWMVAVMGSTAGARSAEDESALGVGRVCSLKSLAALLLWCVRRGL